MRRLTWLGNAAYAYATGRMSALTEESALRALKRVCSRERESAPTLLQLIALATQAAVTSHTIADAMTSTATATATTTARPDAA